MGCGASGETINYAPLGSDARSSACDGLKLLAFKTPPSQWLEQGTDETRFQRLSLHKEINQEV